jgi:hypothetical protein
MRAHVQTFQIAPCSRWKSRLGAPNTLTLRAVKTLFGILAAFEINSSRSAPDVANLILCGGVLIWAGIGRVFDFGAETREPPTPS